MSSILPAAGLSVADICKALESRVAVRKPASPELLLRAEQALNLQMHDFYRQLYASFDGFAGYDEKSWICLWPLERVLSEQLRDENRGDSAIAIGDFMVVRTSLCARSPTRTAASSCCTRASNWRRPRRRSLCVSSPANSISDFSDRGSA